AALQRLAAARGATLFMALIATLDVLLARVCGRDKIVVGAPGGGRDHPDVDGGGGPFLHVLPPRRDGAAGPPVRGWRPRARRAVLDALANQEYPFHVWLNELRRQARRRDVGTYSVYFALDDVGGVPEFAGVRAEPQTPEDFGVSLDSASVPWQTRQALLASATRRGDDWALTLGGDSGRFPAATLDWRIEGWRRVVAHAAAEPGSPIGGIELEPPSGEAAAAVDDDRLAHDLSGRGAAEK